MEAYKIRITKICYLQLLIFAFFSYGVAYSQVLDESRAAEPARASLNNYIQNFITEANYAKYGFGSLDEAKKATLGKPLRVYLIRLDVLQKYTPDKPLKSIFTDPGILWYPVMVNESIKVKMEMVYKDGKWTAGEFGNIKSTKYVADGLKSLSKTAETVIKQPYVVNLLQISALHATFLYLTSAEGDFLIPVMYGPDNYGLENGNIYKAGDILPKLSEYSQKIKGDIIN